MREFVLPFKPEELLAQPSDARLWAGDLPPVDEWNSGEAGSALDALIGRILSTHGYDLAEDESFSLVFALLQAWARLDTGVHARIVDLLTDAARRALAEVGRVKKAAAKSKDQSQQQAAAREARTVAKVIIFFLRWAAERVLRQSVGEAQVPVRGRGRGKGARRGSAAAEAPEQEMTAEEAKDMQKAIERQRVGVLGELANLLGKGALPWLWNGDPSAWQQVAQAVSDAGFLVLDSAEALKQREVRQAALRCISEPLLQEGHQHSNLLVATVSKLLHGLRSGESGAPFAADALALAHATPLPRLILVELTQHCNPAELTSQGAFQRALGSFLVAVADRLPHVILANISVLLPLLDVDCYPLRNAIVESIGQLLMAEGRKLPAGAHCASGGDYAGADGADAEDGAEPAADGGAVPGGQGGAGAGAAAEAGVFNIAPATKRDLLETLVTRSLDKSVWVRYRVLQTLTNLASNTRAAVLPREQWARVLEIATRRMQDTASTTRKASMQLMRTLIEFHPYGPALQGSGDERIKAEQLLREVGVRLRKLQAEEVAEAEQAAKGAEGAGDEEVEVVDEAEPADEEAEGAEVPATMEQTGKRRLKKKTVTEQTITGEVDRCMAEADEGGDRAEERKRQREALRRMQDCYTQRLHFVELLDAAEARLRGLLVSRTASDVTEAIGVVVELRLRGVPAAARAFDQVLGLVWSRQASIKDAAVDAFHRMHLEGRSAASAVQALLEMYQEGCTCGSWTYTHLASVQELIQQAAEKDLIDASEAIPELVAALRGPRCPMALRALTAFGAANGAQLTALLPEICKVLGPGGTNAGGTAAVQLERVRLLCLLLQRLFSCARAPLSEEAWDQIWALSQHATHVVVSAFAHCQVPPQWYGAAQAAMDVSFDIAMAATGRSDSALRSPDKIWEQILTRMVCGLLHQRGGAEAAAAGTAPIMDAARGDGSEGESLAQASESGEVAVVPAEPAEAHKVALPQLGCAVFLGGHLALRMLVFLEGLQSALKRKRLADEDARMTEQREKNKKKTGKKGKGKGDKDEEDDGAQASSMGMAGQEEREADAFAELAETGLLYGTRSLLDRVKPLVFSCLLDPELRKDPILRRAGAISLCKFMTVSKRFCEENLQILFSILFPKGKDAPGGGLLSATADAQDLAQDAAANSSRSGTLFEDLTLRQSLLVAVGDLLFRHPNVVEPWTGRLYGTLSGPALAGPEGASAAELRLTALLVLTHLVLNDMMKPRAVLLVRALWLTACAHDATSRVARILFQELSKRSTNVVYNLLPEIIARLPEHQGATGRVEGGAEGRVHYIMQFVEKEKHIEGLIEKLVIRLEQTSNLAGGAAGSKSSAASVEDVDGTAEGYDDSAPPMRVQETISCLAHALGAMNYTDRCILRLHDAVVVRKALHTALSYHAVARECIMNVVEKARKPRPGREKAGGEAPPAEAEASGAPAAEGGGGAKGGASAAAAAALEAMEQTVMALEQGKEEGAAGQPQPIADGEGAAPAAPSVPAAKPAPSRSARGAAAGKRKAAEADAENPGFDEEQGGKKGRGRGSGRGGGRGAAGGRGRGARAAPAEESRPDAAAQSENAPAGRGGKAPRTGSKAPGAAAAGARKRRSARVADDDDDYEE